MTSLFEFRQNHAAQILRLELQPLDIAFASFVYRFEAASGGKNDSLNHRSVMGLLAGFLSKKLSHQDTCIALQQIPLQVLNTVGVTEKNDLIEIFQQSSLINCVGSELTSEASPETQSVLPLVLENGNLYLQRYYQYEISLAQMIKNRVVEATQFDNDLATNLLEQLFDKSAEGQIDWQMIAVCIAASRQFSMITGGPGTGKTTTVAKLLCFLQGLQQSKLKIQLVAPTGKAAARMADSLSKARTKLPETMQSALNVEAGTIHRLLGSRHHSTKFRHNSYNNLHIDVLIVDEASMVDLPLMCKLFEALPSYTRVVLLGDPNQLASVEAGSVLSDICTAALSAKDNVQYSLDTQKLIEQCTGQTLTEEYSNPAASAIQNSMVKLLKSHRFDSKGGIGKLANAIIAGDVRATISTLKYDYDDIDWQSTNFAYGSADKVNVKSSHDIRHNKLIVPRVAQAVDYFKAVRNSNMKLAFQLLQNQQVLCSQRSGAWGVTAVNRAIEVELAKQGLIDLSLRDYAGRPIMLTQNDHSLGLYNGDIGIVMPDCNRSGIQKVWFNMPNGELQGFLINRLPVYETVYAMTVHKSQGSEFPHVYLCLSETIASEASKGTSRELLYTGLTRARDKFVLFADEKIVQQSVARISDRSSGLTLRLQEST